MRIRLTHDPCVWIHRANGVDREWVHQRHVFPREAGNGMFPSVPALLALADPRIAALNLHTTKLQILKKPGQRFGREILVLSS